VRKEEKLGEERKIETKNNFKRKEDLAWRNSRGRVD